MIRRQTTDSYAIKRKGRLRSPVCGRKFGLSELPLRRTSKRVTGVIGVSDSPVTGT